MKNSTLVVFLLLSSFLSLRAERIAPLEVNNIVLKSFQAIQVASGAKIIWEFTSEERDVTCHIEKSFDGINFSVIHTVFLTSTKAQALQSHIDTDLSPRSYYRLRITKESYIPYISPIVTLSATRDETNSNAFGKSNTVFGNLTEDQTIVSVRLLDLRGQSRIQQQLRGVDLDRSFRSAFGKLPSGYYVLRVSDQQNNLLLNRFIYKL